MVTFNRDDVEFQIILLPDVPFNLQLDVSLKLWRWSALHSLSNVTGTHNLKVLSQELDFLISRVMLFNINLRGSVKDSHAGYQNKNIYKFILFYRYYCILWLWIEFA